MVNNLEKRTQDKKPQGCRRECFGNTATYICKEPDERAKYCNISEGMKGIRFCPYKDKKKYNSEEPKSKPKWYNIFKKK